MILGTAFRIEGMGEERRGVAAGTRRTEGISGAAGTCWRSWKASLSICLSVRNGVASERASPDTREVRSAMTSAMSRARRENRSERRRRKGSSWGRGEGRFRREADKRASTRGERRGEDGGEREGGKEKGLILWSRGRPNSAWRKKRDAQLLSTRFGAD